MKRSLRVYNRGFSSSTFVIRVRLRSFLLIRSAPLRSLMRRRRQQTHHECIRWLIKEVNRRLLSRRPKEADYGIQRVSSGRERRLVNKRAHYTHVKTVFM